eukprot:CAMPEP_0172472188 /NCGR_PEP_ID=MMETSP1065-20121228/68208_1 /TAXON_ID=265537 /ORGANISM="Amphiprora paludosa, Strain CCMP125" /LENGTH=746 /DNA_ID=CAMNT_0013230317 /DNA_START=208 /DNA_END=2448 /DNA_ORIENTATION=+
MSSRGASCSTAILCLLLCFSWTATLPLTQSFSISQQRTFGTIMRNHKSSWMPPPPPSSTVLFSVLPPPPESSTPTKKKTKKKKRRDRIHVRQTVRQAIQIYTEYAGRLWNETNPEVRQQIERNKASQAIRQVIQQMEDENQNNHDNQHDNHHQDMDHHHDDHVDDALDPVLLQSLLEACQAVLMTTSDEEEDDEEEDDHDEEEDAALAAAAAVLAEAHPTNVVASSTHPKNATELATMDVTADISHTQMPSVNDDESTTKAVSSPKPPKKKRRSIWFGAAMGAVVAGWVFSGNYIFTGLFSLMSLLEACQAVLMTTTDEEEDDEEDDEHDEEEDAALAAAAAVLAEAHPTNVAVSPTHPKNVTELATMDVAADMSHPSLPPVNDNDSTTKAVSSAKLPKKKRRSIWFGAAMGAVVAGWVFSGNYIFTPKKKRRSIWFGAAMGAVVAGWVFSGNYIFTGLFSLMTILGQLEYYRMVINTGVYPARRISIVGACSMFWTALFCPQHHQIVLPLFGLWAMIWFLTFKRTVTTIPEIATTFTGMFYLGYVPSFWVRIRLLGSGREATRLAPIVGPLLNLLHLRAETTLPTMIYPKTIHLPITTGAIFIFWTWLCLAFSDVFAYFVGKNLGRTKLAKLAPAAGATSPNKTVEGVLGGCAVSAALGMLGAWVQKWPYWVLTGMVHGTLLALIGLIGDLTASMIKRDAGIKDFGDLIPEHGGILDRVDSFVWTAPYSWLVCHTIIPALKNTIR